MLPVKEESPAGTGLSELPIFSGARGSAQSTPASTLSNVSRAMLTKPESDMLITSAVAATISSGGAILSDTMPTTPPYNPHSTPPPQYIDDAEYISRHVAAAVAAETTTPPDDEFMDDAGSNAESECPALEDESPYDALYRDSEFADDAVPAFPQPSTKPTTTTQPDNRHSSHNGSAVVDVDMTDATEQEPETHSGSVSHANGAQDENHGSDRRQVNGTNEAATLSASTPLVSTSQFDQETPSQATPSEDTIATRRPMRMARLSKPAAPESPKPARQAAKPASNAEESAPGPAPGAEDGTSAATPGADVETPSSEAPVRRASKRVSLAAAAAAAAASPLAKQATTAAAKQAVAMASPKPKAAPAKMTKDTSPPIERRATRQSGLPTDLTIPQPSPQITASGKRRRRDSEKPTLEDLPRELRRLQDTKEFTHVDEEPVVYTVWSNGRYVPANANGEPLVDKNAAKKAAKAAKAAEEAEKKKAEEEAAAERKAAEEKAAAEAALPKKRVKKWMTQGLYAGMPTPSNPAAGLTATERKELAKLPELSKKYPPNKVLPMPIYNGLRSLIQGRDFKMPFDVFNPLPPGQPKPVKYGRFSKNRFVGEAHAIWKKSPNYDDSASKCVCKPETGCDEDCQNRIMLYECNDDICNVGADRCSNREFQRLAERTASKNPYHIGVEVFKTVDRGHGIRASRAFRPGQIIMEYIGEIITEEESDRRMNELYKDNACYYLMSFDQSLIIDGTSGSIARFVNHSCSPNCRMIKWIVSGQPRIALFAGDRPIQTGEELTYDYNFDPYSAKNVQGCLCGADNCRGVLGPRKSEKAVSKAAAEKAAAEKKAKGGNGSAKRKHDAYSMDDSDDTDAASSGPASKKMKVTEAQVKSPVRPVKKATKPPLPKKVVTTTKAALEALAANAARIARLTKASHAARDARIAKAKAKRDAEEAAAAKAKRSKAAKSSKAASSAKATPSKAGSSSATKPAAKVVKAGKGTKVVKTAKGLKASKNTVSKELKTPAKTASKNVKPTKTVQTAKSPARKPATSTAKNSKPVSKPAPKPADKKSASTAQKRATTPVSDDDNSSPSKQPATPQSAHKATPMAQAVAKRSKAAAAAQAASTATAAKKLAASSRSANKIVSKVFAKAKVPVKPLPVKKAAAAKKAGATPPTRIIVATTSDNTPAKRGRGRPRLVAKEPIDVDAVDETPDNAAVVEANNTENVAAGPSAATEADEEEELAAQLATEAAANTSVFEDSALYDTTFDDSMMDDTAGDDAPAKPEPRPRKPRLRKMSKAQKLREKRQLVAARRLAAKQDGSYVPKRGPGRPRKYVKISELQASIADTTMADASSPARTSISTPASALATPATAAADTASPSDAAGTPTPVARPAKGKIEYGVARRGDVEEFKAARARAKARIERMNGTSSADESTAPAEQTATTTTTTTTASAAIRSAVYNAAEDVIHVAPGERVPQV
ncbi:hypothetical protein Sste5346_005863 [Sporothrix stenoceras]|uniref:Histone-lysine N-methyltransferase ASH1L n=1 Tax=Sporothrix stenoceras TaxID=5173 RepID=A0ABR3Z4D5_9PEZI